MTTAAVVVALTALGPVPAPAAEDDVVEDEADEENGCSWVPVLCDGCCCCCAAAPPFGPDGGGKADDAGTPWWWWWCWSVAACAAPRLSVRNGSRWEL